MNNFTNLHWAFSYIGTPWAPGGTGPDEWGCLEFTRHVAKTHYSRVLPDMPTLTPGQTGAADEAQVRESIRDSGWVRVDTPEDGDVVVMRTIEGPHIGMMVRANGHLGVLHSFGTRTKDGRNTGAVRFDDVQTLRSAGVGRLQFWRFQP